jgi:site-specific DNA-methyltransferase (adenine-specific)
MIKISDTEYTSNDGTIRFLQMDCNQFMAGCRDKEFDLNLSDPPFGIDASNQTMGKGKNRKYKERKKTWDKFPPTKECFDEIFRTSKNQIIFGGNYFNLPLIKGWIIWDKDRQKEVSFADGEMAWNSFNGVLRIIKHKYDGFLGADSDGRIHETQKPIDLYRKILSLYTKPTDTILDCFGGSMSNAIACHMERRKLTIIELDSDYFSAAIHRFDQYERQLTLF